MCLDRHVHVNDLDGENVISLSETSNDIFRLHENLFKSRKGRFRSKLVTQNSANAYALILRGLGIGILEPFSSGIWNNNGVVTRPFLPKLVYRYSACFNKNAVRSETINILLTIAREVFSKYEASRAA